MGRRGRAHRHRPYPSPSYFSTQSHTNKINRPRAIHPNDTVGAVPVCPPERSRSGVSIPKIRALCTGNERWMRPRRATRAGTQAPPLPISIKPRGVPLPHYIVHSIAHANHTWCPLPHRIAYSIAPNHAVCPYPIGVILSKAQGWQVQRSLPWVTMQVRGLPPWGLYFFSSHIITTRGEWMESRTQIDFKKYNADGIGSPPRLYPG